MKSSEDGIDASSCVDLPPTSDSGVPADPGCM